MASLQTIIREKFLDAIRSVQPPGKWKALVIDEHSKRLLGSVLKNNDILAEKVTAIDDIANYREPQPQLEAMYLIMPTSKNVNTIIREFSDGRQQYKNAHLFFIEGLPEELFNRLAASPAEPFLAKLSELYLNIWAVESKAFSVNTPELFFGLYGPPRNPASTKVARQRLLEDLRFVSKLIANTCITLDEFPYIRFYSPTHHGPLGVLAPVAADKPAPLPEGTTRWRTNLARGTLAREYEAAEREFPSKILAAMVQESLEDYKKSNPDFPKPSDPPRPRATLLITDRSMDTLAPLLHEFTYQAMANDLLKIEDGTKYSYKIQSPVGGYEEQHAVLSDADVVWTDVRHMHMREAIDKLMADFNRFLQENAGFKGQEGLASLNDMKDMLANLPQYQEQREKFSVHLSMAQECMDIFEKRKLPAVANVEQNCATGLTAEGRTPKTLVEEMVPLLDSKEISNRDKVRIIALYIQFRDGVPDEDRRRLYQHARLTMAEQDALNSLKYLGVRISRGPGERDTKKLKSTGTNDDEYDLSRYKPVLQTVIDDQVNNKLDQSLFPYVKDQPSTTSTASSLRSSPAPQTASLRSARPGWHRPARPGGSVTANRQRLMVFIAGGMTYSEMRVAYQRSAALSKDIYIGSTHTITPEQFVDDLKVLELRGVGSKAIPNGLRESDEAPRSYQQYYDEKYFTKDPPVRQAKLAAPPGKTGGTPLGRPQPSPLSSTTSFQSVTSTNSKLSEKKKKGKFFGF